MSAEQRPRFTMDVLTWRPWLETVDDTGASPEQAALVEEVAPSPDSRAYYALLAHDLPALRERTALFNAIMYGPRGVRRSDRELAAVAASLVNGCVYCTSVHARRYLAPLRAAGLSDMEILDVTHATAIFAWANRLMQTLGEGVPPADASA
ncbi:MAG: carboxymuconolactone decarboxylase family protein [Thermomicrobia bacterium]|nr:carboxymuconolactone decarboxylase family protein [Thermomicrobia bacterium]